MNKLLCLSTICLLAVSAWARPRNHPRGHAPPPPAKAAHSQGTNSPPSAADYWLKGDVETKGAVSGKKTISLAGKELEIASAKITRSGAVATFEGLAVGDYVEVLIDGKSGSSLKVKEVRCGPRPRPISPEQKAEGEGRALQWNQELADKGDAYGQYRMGTRFLNGEGVPKDLEKAREYLSKAAAQGDPSAAAELAKLPAPSPAPQTNSTPAKPEVRSSR
jgi:hypothetical protein